MEMRASGMSNKIRNRFLALILVIAFLALGVLFYSNWVVQKPFAVIVFLTDNLNTATLTAARMYQGGADNRLHLEGLPSLGLLTTHSSDFAVSDTGAAVTAVATGQKVNNRSFGVDAAGQPLATLMDLAAGRGRAVGLVTDNMLGDPAAAAWFARTTDPQDVAGVTAKLVDAPVLDVILGGGEKDLLPEHKDGHRKDGRDLLLEMRRKGYDIVRNKAELENTPSWRPPRLFGVFAPGAMAYADEIQAAGAEPSLAEMVRSAIQVLQFNPKGYLLIVDAGLVGRAAQGNQGERVLRQLIALDAAVGTARAYAGENSLIVVAGRQNVGGLSLNGYPFRNDKGLAVTGINAQGVPSITWSTGPGSGPPTGGDTPREPAAFTLPVAVGVAEDSIVTSSGPGSEKLQGFRDNTDIFRVVVEGL
jgi:alkaline phosphatase